MDQCRCCVGDVLHMVFDVVDIVNPFIVVRTDSR